MEPSVEPYTTTPGGISIPQDGYPELLAVHNFTGGKLSTFCVQKLSSMENFLTSQEVVQWPSHMYMATNGVMTNCTRYKMCEECSTQRQQLLAKLEWKKDQQSEQLTGISGVHPQPTSSIQNLFAVERFLTSKEKVRWPSHYYKTKDGMKLKCTEKNKCQKCTLAREQVISKLQGERAVQQTSVEQLLLNQRIQQWPRHYYKTNDGITRICTAEQICQACTSKRQSPLDLINHKIQKNIRKGNKARRRRIQIHNETPPPHLTRDVLDDSIHNMYNYGNEIPTSHVVNSIATSSGVSNKRAGYSATHFPEDQSGMDNIGHRNSKSKSLTTSALSTTSTQGTVSKDTMIVKFPFKHRSNTNIEFSHEGQQNNKISSTSSDTLDPESSQNKNTVCSTSLVKSLDSTCISETIPSIPHNECIDNIRKAVLSGDNNKFSNTGINHAYDKLSDDVGASDWIISMDEDYVYYFDGAKIKVISNNQNGKGGSTDNTHKEEVNSELLNQITTQSTGRSVNDESNICAGNKVTYVDDIEIHSSKVGNANEYSYFDDSSERCEEDKVYLSSIDLNPKVILNDIFGTISSPINQNLHQMHLPSIDINPKVLLHDIFRTLPSSLNNKLNLAPSKNDSNKQVVTSYNMNPSHPCSPISTITNTEQEFNVYQPIEIVNEQYCNYRQTSNLGTSSSTGAYHKVSSSGKKIKSKPKLKIIQKSRKLQKKKQLREMFKKIFEIELKHKQRDDVEESLVGVNIKTEVKDCCNLPDLNVNPKAALFDIPETSQQRDCIASLDSPETNINQITSQTTHTSQQQTSLNWGKLKELRALCNSTDT